MQSVSKSEVPGGGPLLARRGRTRVQAELLCGAAEFSTVAKAQIAVGAASNYLRTATLVASDKTRNSSPTQHIRGQFLYRGLDADAFSSTSDLSDSLALNRFRALQRYYPLHLSTSRKAEPGKLSFLRSRYRALCLIHLAKS